MSNAILHFPKQFDYQPMIAQMKGLKKFERAFFIGMGGSHLAADLALLWNPNLPLTITSDYGLPPQMSFTKRPRVIVGSYSGNTEETIDAYLTARKRKIPLAVIASGGKLIVRAKKDGVPFIQLPQIAVQPRMALGLALRALLKLLGDENGLKESARLGKSLRPLLAKKEGDALAKTLKEKIPVIYSSTRNFALAYNWKIKMNETGKIPAFYNLLPELNHNEMNGFDVQPSTISLCQAFSFVLLRDKKDHPRLQKRMDILERLYRQRGLSVHTQNVEGKNPFEKMFTSLLVADWTALAISEQYGLEAEQVPLVEEFKKYM